MTAHPSETRRLLLEAAILCFAEKGFEATTTREIAGRVVAIGQFGKFFIRILCLACLFQGREPRAVSLRWPRFGLMPTFHPHLEWWSKVKPVLLAVGPGELAINKNGTAGVPASRCF